MPLTQLAPPYPIFTDKNGDPLDAGFLYFGVADQNPETNPITVYWDNAFTQPVAQPIRTINGYPSRNGSPAAVYANDYFSVTVRNKNSELVIYSTSNYGITPGTSASFASQVSILDAGNYYTSSNVEDALQEIGGIKNPKDFSDLIADTELTYVSGQAGSVSSGDIIRTRAEGFSYEVAASGASDQHVTTAGGVKLYALPGEDGAVNLKALGLGGTATENATAFLVAISAGFSHIIARGGPYTFDFGGTAATFSGNSLTIDLGEEKHTWDDFGGLTANSLTQFKLNMRIGCNDTPLQSIIKSSSVELIEIDTIEVTDVYWVEPALSPFFFQVQHTVEKPFQFTCNNATFKNIVVAGNAFASGSTYPITIFGNFNSSSTLTTMHFYNFGNLDVENFYTVDVADPSTIIDGDSDVFRMFNNPSSVNIENLRVVNVAKRFLKSQEECIFTVGYCLTTLDNRFTGSLNHIGTFEAQYVNQTKPSRCIIKSADIDYSAAGGKPVLYNASGFDHEFSLSNAKYKNCSIFSSTQNIAVRLENVEGEGLQLLVANSDRVYVKGIVDTSMPRWLTSLNIIEYFEITPDNSSTSALLSNATLANGKFVGCDTGDVLATFYRLENITVTYTTSARGDGRPFRPFDTSGGRSLANDINITNTTGQTVNYFYSPGGSGKIIARDVSFNAGALGFLPTGGTWDIVEDNCDGTMVGGGINSQLVATYT
jgi:hypothetical protein